MKRPIPVHREDLTLVGLPGVERKLFHALPTRDWERQKDRYFFEWWLDAAGKEVTNQKPD